MSSNEAKTQEITYNVKSQNLKCRIPQRLAITKSKPPTALKRVSSPETGSRPKSANRAKDEPVNARLTRPNTRMTRAPPYSQVNSKRPPVLHKRRDNSIHGKGRPLIMVPKMSCGKTTIEKIELPDQETITKYEDMERQSTVSEHTGLVQEDAIVPVSRSEELIKLKVLWQEKSIKFETLKNELSLYQREILEVYASMRELHMKMSGLGEPTELVEDLKVLNVAQLSPDKLLQLCSEQQNYGDGHRIDVTQITIPEIKKMYKMPTKLVNACEETLRKRKEIIDWFEGLKTVEKGVSMATLDMKIKEFNAENDMMKTSLEQAKSEFYEELDEIIQYMKKGTVDTMNLQVRTEDLTYEISELNAQNSDLRKQISNLENLRSRTAKSKLEELEKELKEEKCKRLFLKDRLTRAEGQVKINAERATQLDAALEQARSQTWSLERTVKTLHDQNHKLQNDFDKELNKLTQSIREHTIHLEEIAQERERIQSEKQNLEKRLVELSDYYEEALNTVKTDLSNNLKKLIDTEKKLHQETDEKTKLELKIQEINKELNDTNMKLDVTIQELEEKNNQLVIMKQLQNELQLTSKQLDEAQSQIESYKNKLVEHNENMVELEKKYKDSIDLQHKLLNDMTSKTGYISELEKKQYVLEQQLQDNEIKMEDYVKQLSVLKKHIAQLQKDFGQFENLEELRDMVNEQRVQLQDVIRAKNEIEIELQKKEEQIEQLSMSLAKQEEIMDQHENTIKILSNNEKEQTNIIKMLRTNLELRNQADNDLSQQIIEKETEIKTLVANLETRKQQISNLEEIILALENQNNLAALQEKKDQEIIAMLQNVINEYDPYPMDFMSNNDAAENFDNIIKRIEEELHTPLDPNIKYKDYDDVNYRKQFIGDRRRKEHKHNIPYKTHNDNIHPISTRMDSYKKSCSVDDEDTTQYQGDSCLDRKQGITHIKQMKREIPESEVPRHFKNKINPNDTYSESNGHSRSYYGKNLEILTTSEHRDERKFKMLKKLAGHKI